MMRVLNLSQYFKILHIAGDQASNFLQGQLTNDVTQARTDQLQWQAYCTRDGLVQSIFALWGEEKNYYLLITADLADTIQQLLQKYARFSNVACTLCPERKITLALQSAENKTLQWQINRFDTEQLQLTWQSVFSDCADDFALLRATLIDHEFPWLCQATSGCFRPHDIHLPQLQIVCFTKGCFPGQEIIARMQYRGKPKQGFYVFHLPGQHDVLPGQHIIRKEKQVGQIVDAVYFSDQTALSMVLQHEWRDQVW